MWNNNNGTKNNKSHLKNNNNNCLPQTTVDQSNSIFCFNLQNRQPQEKSQHEISICTDSPDFILTEFKAPVRYYYLFVIFFAGMLGTITTNIHLPAIFELKQDLKPSEMVNDLLISLFLVTSGLSPFFWGPLSEVHGRRIIYIISTSIVIATSIGCFFSPNIYTLLAMRTIKGIGTSASRVVGSGIVVDIFPPNERPNASRIFFLGPLLGPFIGPIIGGYVSTYFGWRETFLFVTIAESFLLVLLIFTTKETLNTKRKLKSKTEIFKLFAKPLTMLRDKIVLIGTFVIIIAFIYNNNIYSTQAKVMISRYNVSRIHSGWTYAPTGLGCLASSLIPFIKSNKKSSTKKIQEPSQILKSTYITTFLLISGLLMNGWFLNFRLPIYAPLISQFLIGFGSTHIISSGSAYLVEMFPSQSTLVSACPSCLRTIIGGLLNSVDSIITETISIGWHFTIFAALCIVMAGLIQVLIRFSRSATKLNL